MAKHGTLLVVDDEPLNRDLLRRVFYQDYDIHEAEDAVAAVKVLEQGAVDVVVCDHLMPGKSGAELAKDIRDRWPTSVFVLLTGYEDAPEVDAAKRAGAIFEIVGKPWVARSLREAIARALEEGLRRKA